MMDSELKKTSMRANSLEKKRFEMMLAAFDSAKRNVAVDMKKSQLEFKRRLKRYKDRQREIIRNRSDPDASSMEEFILKHLRRRGQMSRSPSRPLTTSPSRLSAHPHSTPRPPTPPRPHASVSFSSDSNTTNNSNNSTHGTNTSTHDINTSNSSDNSQRTARTRALTSTAASSALEEDEEDVVILSHCRRSKVDLRPYTAWSAVRQSSEWSAVRQSSEWFKTKATKPGGPRLNAGNVKLLQLRGGRLGTPARQVRYLNDEEIEERGTFYRFLLDGYRHMEHNRLQSLGHRVNQFCGKTAGADSSNSGDTSCPPLVKVGVVSLPPGVPPIIQQAMRVKVSLLNSPVGVHRAEMR